MSFFKRNSRTGGIKSLFSPNTVRNNGYEDDEDEENIETDECDGENENEDDGNTFCPDNNSDSDECEEDEEI